MKYLLIRHAKTDANRLTRVAFGIRGAPINIIGEAQSIRLGEIIRSLGIDASRERVAVSELIRTQQTAEHAGFKNIVPYPLLNEVKSSNPQKTQELIKQKIIPLAALESAQRILANPPKEKIWVTHGLVIAALLKELSIDTDIFIPDFCEIVEINL